MFAGRMVKTAALEHFNLFRSLKTFETSSRACRNLDTQNSANSRILTEPIKEWAEPLCT